MDGGTVLNLNNVRNRVLVSTCKRVRIPQVSWRNFRYYSDQGKSVWRHHKALQAVEANRFATQLFLHATAAGGVEAAGG